MVVITKALIRLHRCADQPAHLCSLISAFVIGYQENTVVKLSPCKISISYLISVAEQIMCIFTPFLQRVHPRHYHQTLKHLFHCWERNWLPHIEHNKLCQENPAQIHHLKMELVSHQYHQQHRLTKNPQVQRRVGIFHHLRHRL